MSTTTKSADTPHEDKSAEAQSALRALTARFQWESLDSYAAAELKRRQESTQRMLRRAAQHF